MMLRLASLLPLVLTPVIDYLSFLDLHLCVAYSSPAPQAKVGFEPTAIPPSNFSTYEPVKQSYFAAPATTTATSVPTEKVYTLHAAAMQNEPSIFVPQKATFIDNVPLFGDMISDPSVLELLTQQQEPTTRDSKLLESTPNSLLQSAYYAIYDCLRSLRQQFDSGLSPMRENMFRFIWCAIICIIMSNRILR